MIRGRKMTTLILKKGVLSEADIGRLRDFCNQRGFDPVWFPGIDPGEVNRRNCVPRPWLHEAAAALSGDDHERFLADYKFNIRPATDDRPTSFIFSLGFAAGIDRTARPGWADAARYGVPRAGPHLVLALPLSLLLVLVPLATLGRRPDNRSRVRPGIYFLCLGLAFLFVEIACIQRYGLFVGHPYSPPCPRWWVS